MNTTPSHRIKNASLLLQLASWAAVVALITLPGTPPLSLSDYLGLGFTHVAGYTATVWLAEHKLTNLSNSTVICINQRFSALLCLILATHVLIVGEVPSLILRYGYVLALATYLGTLVWLERRTALARKQWLDSELAHILNGTKELR